ncbi:MAG: nicotinamidase-related amidase [Candidatus Latescibacterota bacterium]|jgi:nicotinamidase-related amidase
MSDKWKDYVLMLIDLQSAFYPEGTQAAFPELPANVERVVATCRTEGIDIIHIRSRFRKDKSDWMPKYKKGNSIPCIEGSEGIKVLPFAKELRGEPVLYKQTFDAFLLPDTAELIQKINKRLVIIAGLVTKTCVFHATLSSSQLFPTGIVEDCCASPNDHEESLQRLDAYVVGRTRSDTILKDCERWREHIMNS